MTAVQPFSYLTVQPAPPKPAFLRPEEDPVETADTFLSGELNTQENGGHLSQSSVALHYQHDYQRPPVSLVRAQTETSYDLKQHQQQQQQQQPEVAYIENRIRRPPDVAPKHVKALESETWEAPKEEAVYGRANKGALYAQPNPLALNRPQEKTEPFRDPDFGNADNLYGQPNRHREPYSQDARQATPQSVSSDAVPFSYTQPIGLSGGATYGDIESRNGVGSKHSNYSQAELGNRAKESPAIENQTIFENFILVGPEKPQTRELAPKHNYSQVEIGNRVKEPPAVGTVENQTIFENFILVGPEKPQTREVAPKEPGKRLKLQELFDPPPPQPAPAPQDPRKLSIFGVTNTESSDFHNTANSTPKDSDRTKTKTPVSTFDNPDYNLQNPTYRPYGYVQGSRDDRPWSPTHGANNALDAVGKSAAASAPRRPPTQGRCQSNKMCVAVLITALITSLVCLGAGFIAGWFGRGRSLGY